MAAGAILVIVGVVYLDLRRGYKIGDRFEPPEREGVHRVIEHPNAEDVDYLRREYSVTIQQRNKAYLVKYTGPLLKAPLPFMVFYIVEVDDQGRIAAVHLTSE